MGGAVPELEEVDKVRLSRCVLTATEYKKASLDRRNHDDTKGIMNLRRRERLQNMMKTSCAFIQKS